MELFAFDPPDLAPGEVTQILRDHWDLGAAEHRALHGERSHNSIVTVADGRRFVLHVVSASERADVVDLQTAVMAHLAEHAPDLPTPHPVATVDGAMLARVERAGAVHLTRLVTYLPGTTFDMSEPYPADTYRDIGALLGRTAAMLTDLSHPAADHFMPWDIANGLIVDDELLRSVRDPEVAGYVAELRPHLERVAAVMERLPRRLIHNDGHAGNLMRVDDRAVAVTGLIDFGDTVRTITAADVAIAAESFAVSHATPHVVLAELARGYHAHVRLTDAEVAALPDLVLARAALGLMLTDRLIAIADGDEDADEMREWMHDRLALTRRWVTLDRHRLTDTVAAALARDTHTPGSPR